MNSSTTRLSTDSASPTSPPPTRSEYPFPRSASSNRYQLCRGSTASSISSVGGSLDTSLHSHGVSESSQNAISTLLQAPIVRTGLLPHTSAPSSATYKAPSARDIAPVTLTNIPTVNPSAFREYLAQVGSVYDALQRAKETDDGSNSHNLRRGSKPDDFSEFLAQERRSSNRDSLARQASLASLTSLTSSIEASSPSGKRLNKDGGKRALHAPTPLSTIPSVYFEENFHLENPRTFDVVSERSEVVRPVPGTPDERKGSNGNPAGPRKALATNAILQEKLSWYMDTIEVHLISSISAASTSFFAALGSLRELHSEAADSVSRIKMLRTELEALDNEMAVGGLEVVKKKRRKENLKQLSDTVQQLKSVVAALRESEGYVDDGQVEKALDSIDKMERIIAGHRATDGQTVSCQLRDLRGAAALQGVNADINSLRYRVGKIYESRLITALLSDLKEHTSKVSIPDSLQRWNNASGRSRGGHNRETSVQPTYIFIKDALRSELLMNVIGLERANYISPAIASYRETVLKEVRNTIRRALPASNDDDADSMMSSSTVGGGRHRTPQEKSSILSRNLKALDPDDADELLKKTYVGIGETLRRVGAQMKVLLDVTSSLGESRPGAGVIKSPPRSPNMAALDGRLSPGLRGNNGLNIQEEMHQALDISNLLGQAVDVAQDKVLKVLRARTDQSTSLSVEHFLRYFQLNLLFANECEAVSSRSGTALKTFVNGQIKDFVRKLGETERQLLATDMEADPWNAKDFSDLDKEILARILSASTRDSEAWTSSSRIWQSIPAPQMPTVASILAMETNGASGTSTPSAPSSKTAVRPAIIEGESFLLPVSAVLCLHGLCSFMHLNSGIPSMTTDIATVIVSYLSLFNSRCTQLILGAGAMRSAGLKNITTKHLALAAQALSFISNLIPHIREFVRRHAPTGMSVSLTMGEFDKVRRAYLEHQQSIYDKLVDIMAGRATAHTKSMKTIQWDEPGKDGVNTYMETLTKETSTLHKVLSKHLPEMTVRMIMEPVFKSYKEQWGKAFSDVVLPDEEARSRLLRDAEHFRSKIGGLEGSNGTGEFLVQLVHDKRVPKAAPPVQPVSRDSVTIESGEKAKESSSTSPPPTARDEAVTERSSAE